MITIRNLVLRRGPNVLLQDVNWTIYHKQHIGVIGANGSGKSSLFAVLQGQLHADKGDVEIPRQLKLASVAQETPAYTQSALDFVLDGDEELRSLEKQLTIAEEKNDGEAIANIHIRLGEIDSYTASSRAAKLLSGLGFTDTEQQQSVSSFSGGFRMRLNLAKALMCPSDVLLLDEPTNHLDLDAVIWLEQWLIKYTGTLLLISHDRDFLDHVVGHIAHVSGKQITLYTGNYSSFEKQRAEKILLQQAAYEKQQKQIAHMQSFVDRFRAKASKARQAQSRMKAIGRMELVNVVHIDEAFQFEFKEPDKCPNPLIYIDEATVGYGEKIVLHDVHLSIAPRERIALLGPNGAGKSTLIKLLAGELSPMSGVREVSQGLKIGYFAQHQVDSLQLDESPLLHFKLLSPGTHEQQLRGFLGSFGFSGNRVTESVKQFSGGEKSRLALAMIAWQKPNLLLLDEPTNHLDLDTRHALNMALQEFSGSVILVSHDRFLINSTCDKLLLVANGAVQNFEGDLDDYEKWLFEFRKLAPQESSVDKTSRKSQRQEEAQAREAKRPLLLQIKKLEDEMVALEKQADKIELSLADSSLYEIQNKVKLQALLEEQVKIKKKLEDVEKEWLRLNRDV